MNNDVPYKEEKISDNIYQRTFKFNIDTDEVIWHKDKEDRIVEVIENNGSWMIQLDNQLPLPLKGKIFVPKETYHRAIKGNGDLIVNVTKLSS
tara:strand:- start:491 stop:769 length:279 start_codon:yes stop_codon:yes gene_type:complete